MKELLFIPILMLSLYSITAKASDENADSTKHAFNTVEFIFKHVNDSYEWHFYTNKQKHAAVPLPVILYSSETGLNVFLSTKLHEDTSSQRFYIQHGGPYDGKIVEKLNTGEIVRPIDFSITKSVFGAMLVALLVTTFSIVVAKRTKQNPMAPPKGMQNLLEPIVGFVRDEIAKPFVGHEYKRFLPYLLSLFSFILIANLTGLILPLGFNITGNISITLVLALFTYIITTFTAKKAYWMHIINPDVPVFLKFPIPIMPFVEFAGTIIKPMVLMIRLFANMFSGHIIVTVLVSLIYIMSQMFGPWVASGTSIVAIFFSVFMMMIDILVSFIQAYIFTLLTALYFGMATDSRH
jgi:F-type H+-transporting ATPase subunit a